MTTVNVALERSVAQSLADSLAAAGVHAGDTSKPDQPEHPIVLPPTNEVPPTPPGVTPVEIDWNVPGRYSVPMTAESVAAIHFRTGPDGTPPNRMHKLVCAEYGTNPVPRTVALTTLPGQFLTHLGPPLSGSSTVTCQFTVAPANNGYYPMLAPNSDYYLNIKVAPNSAAPGQNCAMYCDWIK